MVLQVLDPKGLHEEHFDGIRHRAKIIALIKAMWRRSRSVTLNCDPMFPRARPIASPRHIGRWWIVHGEDDPRSKTSTSHRLHPESDFKKKITSDATFRRTIRAYGRAIAKHFSFRSIRKSFLEVLNEPESQRTDNAERGVKAQVAERQFATARRTHIIAAGSPLVLIEDISLPRNRCTTPTSFKFSFHDQDIFLFLKAATGSTNFQHYLREINFRSVDPYEKRSRRRTVARSPTRSTNKTVAAFTAFARWNARERDAEIASGCRGVRGGTFRLPANEFGVYRGTSNTKLSRSSDSRRPHPRSRKIQIGGTMTGGQASNTLTAGGRRGNRSRLGCPCHTAKKMSVTHSRRKSPSKHWDVSVKGGKRNGTNGPL